MVEIPDESNQAVELAGGESTILSVWNEDYDENIDVEQISFEYTNTNDYFNIVGKKIFVGKWSRITIEAQKKGSCVVLAKYNGRILKNGLSILHQIGLNTLAMSTGENRLKTRFGQMECPLKKNVMQRRVI